MKMTTEDSSGEKEVTTEKEQGDDASKSEKSNIIILFPLFCKFAVVLMIKFLTDLIVYPSLLLYRLGRRTKRKIIGWFGKISFRSLPSSVKPNGTKQ
jgi:hypothetical protein